MRALLLFFFLLFGLLARAQPIVLDSTFGVGGKLVLDSIVYGPQYDCKVVGLGEGRLALAYRHWSTAYLLVLSSDGSIDTSFGEMGLVTFGNAEQLIGLFVRPSGKILLVTGTDSVGYIRSFEANGDVDSSYGVDGLAMLTYQGTPVRLYGADLKMDDRLLLSGSVDFGGYEQGFVGRLTSSGEIDPSFNGSGFHVFQEDGPVSTSYPCSPVVEYSDGAHFIGSRGALDQNGTIYVGGFYHPVFRPALIDGTDRLIMSGLDEEPYTMYWSVEFYDRGNMGNHGPNYRYSLYASWSAFGSSEPARGRLRALASDPSVNTYAALSMEHGDTLGWKIIRNSDPEILPIQWAIAYTEFDSASVAMPLSMEVLDDGKLVVAGRSSINGVEHPVLARYINIADPRAQLDLRVYLGGALDTATLLMRDDLRSADLLPSQQPYTALGYTSVNGTGPWAMPASVLSITGPDAVVDWLWLELLSPTDTSTVLCTRVAVLHRDGRVTQANGHSPVDFDLGAGNYFLHVRHRNHLSITCATPLTLGNTPLTVDLISPTASVFGTDARMEVSGLSLLWPGDATGDGVVKYMGAGNDRDAILAAIGGTPPTATAVGYLNTDVNMDGIVRYHGLDNDREVVLQTIGGVVPTAVRVAQQP